MIVFFNYPVSGGLYFHLAVSPCVYSACHLSHKEERASTSCSSIEVINPEKQGMCMRRRSEGTDGVNA